MEKKTACPFSVDGALTNLVQLCDTPFGIAILNCELQYTSVNEKFAKISGRSVAHCVGRMPGEIVPGIAWQLEPLFKQVLASGKPASIEIEGTLGDSEENHIWVVSGYPLISEDGFALGIGSIFHDMTGQRLKEQALDERLKFEALLSDLSATFVNVPADEIDQKIELWLRNIVEFLDFDRSSLYQFSKGDGRAYLTHSYSLPNIKPPPAIADEVLPVWVAMVRRGEMFFVSDQADIPEDQWREIEYCERQGGIKSIVGIPLKVGKHVLGCSSFVSYRPKISWSDEFVQRLRIVGEIFANALERKRAEQQIQLAFKEINRLKDHLQAENLYLRDQIEIKHKHGEIIGQSNAIRNVLRQVEQVAHTDATVLILGETGTGKELLARAIHKLSPRKDRAMVGVNCAALPTTLIESELFGHEKGAFTGAMNKRIGRFESADGSTMFLDEVGELPLELQAKLLRVLQEGQFERLGSSKTHDVDVRIVAATNRDLTKAVAQGKFREDLFYRLNVFPIAVPPLRERKEDIPLLVWAMVREYGETFGKIIERIPKKSLDGLQSYTWPGNIRELRNVIERAMILSPGTTLHVELPSGSALAASQFMSLEEIERSHIRSVLEKTGWRIRGKRGAAEILELKPTTLESKMEKLGIDRPQAHEIP